MYETKRDFLETRENIRTLLSPSVSLCFRSRFLSLSLSLYLSLLHYLFPSFLSLTQCNSLFLRFSSLLYPQPVSFYFCLNRTSRFCQTEFDKRARRTIGKEHSSTTVFGQIENVWAHASRQCNKRFCPSETQREGKNVFVVAARSSREREDNVQHAERAGTIVGLKAQKRRKEKKKKKKRKN